MAIIKTKIPNFTGLRANVMFTKGVGETEDKHLIEWFRSHGYNVEEAKVVVAPKVEEPEAAIDLEAMSVEELKEHAKAIGKGRGVGVLKTKEQLIRHIAKE